MKAYGVNELRRMYLEFFESKDHLSMNSFSLVPHNDNSLLLINAGMAPLKPYFTGQEIPPRNRVTTCQKCVRTGDIENVGKTARHLTFFEMLGNFSFGDYFKLEAIQWSWEFLTEVLGMEPERLYPSIYFEDDEAFEIWNKVIGVPAEKITRFYRDENGKCDNFWEHGAGPCGPCSEIYYDRGEKYGCGSPDCKVGCECDRFMEVWNNVFTQYNGDGNGNYEELANKNIDTGMGLERLAAVVQDVNSVFDIDTMKAIRDRICEIAGVEYQSDEAKDVSIRLITDHIRSSTFLISDGVMPSNEGRGYVLRRLIRRAARHGRLLGIKDKFLANLSQTVIAESKDGYPELEEKKAFILNVLTQEEDKFDKTIDQGLAILGEMKEAMKAEGSTVLTGENAFKLYDTYGFPLDLTEEILAESGMSLDEEGFKAAMQEQREKARKARKVTNYMGADATVYDEIDTAITSEFVGYEDLTHESKVTVLTTETEIVEALSDGEVGTIIVDETPFYATMGGQNADLGVIVGPEGEFVVKDTIFVQSPRKSDHAAFVVDKGFNFGVGRKFRSSGGGKPFFRVINRFGRVIRQIDRPGSFGLIFPFAFGEKAAHNQFVGIDFHNESHIGVAGGDDIAHKHGMPIGKTTGVDCGKFVLPDIQFVGKSTVDMPGKLDHLGVFFQHFAPPAVAPGVAVIDGIGSGHVVNEENRFIGSIFDCLEYKLFKLLLTDGLTDGNEVVTFDFGDGFRGMKNFQTCAHVAENLVL